MYPDVITFNPLAGDCIHDCKYCYRNNFKARYKRHKDKYSGEPRLDLKGMSKLREWHKDVFVCSMTDLFADNVPSECISRIFKHIKLFPDNTYLLQTKNPARYFSWLDEIKSLKSIILGITLETDRFYEISEAVPPAERTNAFADIKNIDKFVSIEPIIDFSMRELVEMIAIIQPKYVSIGADSKNHGLIEPEPDKVKQLIAELKKFTEVRIKPNLNRILK